MIPHIGAERVNLCLSNSFFKLVAVALFFQGYEYNQEQENITRKRCKIMLKLGSHWKKTRKLKHKAASVALWQSEELTLKKVLCSKHESNLFFLMIGLTISAC